jgi:3-hydroxyisobutyrate dehydrogenase-like beta-hydroxyacid dehydrogenase
VIGDDTVGILGLGEAGSELARDLVAGGRTVRAWDPDPARRVPGVEAARDAADAARDAALVLSVNSAEAARDAAAAAAAGLGEGAVFADLNTGAAQLKRELAATTEAAGALFADVGVMAPVPGRGLRTPFVASGSGASRFAELLRPLGAHVEVLPDGPGAAATRKLLRSVFMKGLAAAVLEGSAGARAAGCEDWFLQHVADTLASADGSLAARLVGGSGAHAGRRVHELDVAAELLRELAVHPHVTVAARAVLAELDDG